MRRPRVRLKHATPRLPQALRDPQARYPRVTNLVVKARFNQPIFPYYLMLHLPYAEFVPMSLPAVKLRLARCGGASNTTCLVFNTGQVMLIGAKSFYTVCRDLHFFQTLLQGIPQPVLVDGDTSSRGKEPARLLPTKARLQALLVDKEWSRHVRARPLGTHLRVCQVRTENVCSTTQLSSFNIDLARFHRAHPDCTQYQPEKFPGLKVQLNPFLRDAGFGPAGPTLRRTKPDKPEKQTGATKVTTIPQSLLQERGRQRDCQTYDSSDSAARPAEARQDDESECIDFRLVPPPPIYIPKPLRRGHDDGQSMLSASQIEETLMRRWSGAREDNRGVATSICATIFDTGKCNMYGRRNAKQGRCAARILARRMEQFRDDQKPQDARHIYAYRCRQYLKQDEEMAEHDVSRFLLLGDTGDAEASGVDMDEGSLSCENAAHAKDEDMMSLHESMGDGWVLPDNKQFRLPDDGGYEHYDKDSDGGDDLQGLMKAIE